MENRKASRATWLPKEWGNWIADKIASGIESSLSDFDVKWVEVKCSHILNDICANGVWHLTNLNGDVSLSSPEQTVRRVNNSEYLYLRDLKHAERLGHPTDPPALFWRDASIGLAAKVWDMASKPITMAARAQRVFFDKLWLSWNIVKGVPGTEVICPLCAQPDSLSHLVRICTDVTCACIRNEGLNEITALGNKLHPASKWLSETIVMLATSHASGSNIFTGMWNSDLRNALRALINHSGHVVTTALISQWKVTLDDVSHSLVLITRALVANRLAGVDAPPQDLSIGEKISTDRRTRIARRKKEKHRTVRTRRDDSNGPNIGPDPLSIPLSTSASLGAPVTPFLHLHPNDTILK